MKPMTRWTAALLVVWASVLTAQDVKVLTVEDHDRAMKAILGHSRVVLKLLDAGDLQEMKRNYLGIRDQLVGVRGFWEMKKNDDAVTMVTTAIAKAEGIVAAVDAKADRPTIDARIKELVDSCGACHAKFREPDPATPGSHVIKEGIL
ncbi:MAG: hypothetical protein ABL986_22430 [Vicinamibacterales bacterium]